MQIAIEKVNPTKKDFNILRAIRQEVFVVEQEVDPKEEFDAFVFKLKS